VNPRIRTAEPAFATVEAAIEAARAARAEGRFDDELAAAQAASALAPERWDAWVALAGAAGRARRPELIEQAQLRALETTTDPAMRSRLSVDLAWTLASNGRWAEAAALAREPRPEIEHEPAVRAILGATLAAVGAGAEAAPHVEFAVRAMPGRPDYWFNLAVLYNSLGRVDEAVAAAERAIQAAPNHAPAYELVGLLQTPTPERNQVARLQAVRSRMPAGQAAAKLDFALFKQLDQLGRTDEAWQVLTRANETIALGSPWSQADDDALAAAMASAFPRPKTNAAKTGRPRPVFILGLPRTGTTLVERIFAAHSKVKPLGELVAFGRAARRGAGADGGPYMDIRVAQAAETVDWKAVGAEYRAEIDGLAGGAEAITDKMPPNWWYAGAIAAALPDAVMVHVRRSPMDTLFGAYKMSFGPVFDWSYRFADLAAHYRIYRRLTDHWRATLGAAWIDVDYETLVTDPASAVPRLLEACGLPFEEACLDPHLAEGAVSTPSASQVREPVTSGKIGSWRRYAVQLEPLKALLHADGWVDDAGDPPS